MKIDYKKILVLIFALSFVAFILNYSSEEKVFISEFYLNNNQTEELPESFTVTGDIEHLTPQYNYKISRYTLSNNSDEELEFKFSVGEGYKILSSDTLNLSNNEFKEHIIEIQDKNSNKVSKFSILTTNKYFPKYIVNIDNPQDIADGYIYTSFKNFRNYTFFEAIALITEFSFSEFKAWTNTINRNPAGPVFEQTQKYLNNIDAKSNAMVLDKFGVPLVIIQGNLSYSDFKYIEGLGNVLGVYGVPPAQGVLIGKYKVYDDEFNKLYEIKWSEKSYLDVHDIDFDVQTNRLLKIGYSEYIPGTSTITEKIWSSSYLIEQNNTMINVWDAFLNYPLGASKDSFKENPNWDVFHINSARMYDENVLVSLRHTNSISLIDSEANVLWTIANNEKINDFKILEDPFEVFYGQHDAKLINNDQLTIFDNQNGQENVARGVVYQIDENEKTAIFIKHFLLDEDALCCGSFQLLNQGAILSGGSEGTIYEFVDELSSPNLKIDIGGIVYRAVKIER